MTTLAVYAGDVVFVGIGVILTAYMLGCFVLWWRQRPAVVRHPYDSKRWVAARSMILNPPPTMEQTIKRIRVIPRDRMKYD